MMRDPDDARANGPQTDDVVALLPRGALIADRYRIEEVLGLGGFGAVYEAVNLPTGRVVALKTLLPDVPQAGDMVARFRREALASHRLDHPNIVETLDVGLEGGHVFMAMELVRGVSLRKALASGPLAVRRSLVLMRQILEGVGHAHAQGFVHRDLKPDNVMLTMAGEPGAEYEVVKLLDFGLVKLLGDAALELGAEQLTRTGMIYGTPAYMAPEQALGRAVDGRADLYALGAMLFEMLTGRRPFEASDPLTMLRLHVAQPVPELCERVGSRPWQTRQLEALVRGALEKRVESRFKSASEMIEALDAAFVSLNHLPAGT